MIHYLGFHMNSVEFYGIQLHSISVSYVLYTLTDIDIKSFAEKFTFYIVNSLQRTQRWGVYNHILWVSTPQPLSKDPQFSAKEILQRRQALAARRQVEGLWVLRLKVAGGGCADIAHP